MNLKRTQTATPTEDHATLRELIEVTRAWWDLGAKRPMRRLTILEPQEVLAALQAGAFVQWQDG